MSRWEWFGRATAWILGLCAYTAAYPMLFQFSTTDTIWVMIGALIGVVYCLTLGQCFWPQEKKDGVQGQTEH